MTQQKNNLSTFESATSHPKFKNFLVYCLIYIIFGQIITAVGPMFPYLSEKENRHQTQYSILFTARAFGFMCGSVLLRFISHKFTIHQAIMLGVYIMSITSILFNSTSNLYIRALYIYIGSIGCSFIDININLGAVECFKKDNLSGWLQVVHGGFGIGGLLGPFVVYLLELSTLTVLGFIVILCTIFFYFIETPENKDQKQGDQDQKIMTLPNKSIYLICIAFLLAVGQQVSYGGWISSYTVLKQFSTKQHATFYSSLYWISITFFRFALALLSGSSSFKIKMLGYIGIGTTFLSYFLIYYVHVETGLVIMSILYGLTNSVLFPLLLTIPEQFGYKLTIHESTYFIIFASVGEGCLAVFVGKLMGWLSYDWLIYSMFLINVSLVIIMIVNTDFLQKQKADINQKGSLKKFITAHQNQIQMVQKLNFQAIK